jgi:hypothetical protein
MERAFHSTSHLGPCNVDRLIPYTPVSLRRHLEIYRNAALSKMRNGLTQATGDMWTRGWEMYKEYSDQITLMDTEVIGRTS